MKYIKPDAAIVEFEAVSVILTSATTATTPSVDEDDDRLPDVEIPDTLNFYE